MIKPINISPINSSDELHYICDQCGASGNIKLNGVVIDTDDQGNSTEGLYNYECQKCGHNLKNSITMHLENQPFRLIQDGHKTIEVRLNDSKRQSLEIGDIMEFINRKTDEKIKVEIMDLLRYKNFEDLIDKYPIFDFGDSNKENLLKSIKKHYSKEDEDKYGVLGIRVKVLK